MFERTTLFREPRVLVLEYCPVVWGETLVTRLRIQLVLTAWSAKAGLNAYIMCFFRCCEEVVDPSIRYTGWAVWLLQTFFGFGACSTQEGGLLRWEKLTPLI